MLNRVEQKYISEVSGQQYIGIKVDMGVPYSVFRDPKDFNKPPGVYWIQGTGGHYSEWNGQKFDDNTKAAKKATNDYYQDWHDSCHYYATGGKIGTWSREMDNITFDKTIGHLSLSENAPLIVSGLELKPININGDSSSE